MEFASTQTFTCLRRLKNKNKTGRMELSDFFQSAEADIVCIGANSIRTSYLLLFHQLLNRLANPIETNF